MYSDKQIVDFMFEENYHKLSKFIEKEIDNELKNNLFLYDFKKLNQLMELIFQKGDSYYFSYIKDRYFRGNILNKGIRLISSLSIVNCIKLLDKIEPILINDVVQSKNVKLSELIDNIQITNYEHLNFQIMLQVENDLNTERFEQFIDAIVSNSQGLKNIYVNPYKISTDDFYFEMFKKYIAPYLIGRRYEIYLYQPDSIKNDNNYYRFVNLKDAILYKDVVINTERLNSFGLKIVERYSKEMKRTTIDYISDNLSEHLSKVISPSYYIRLRVRKGLTSKVILNKDIVELFQGIPVTEELLEDIFNIKIARECFTPIYEQANYNELPKRIKSGEGVYSYNSTTVVSEVIKLLENKEDIPNDFFINNPSVFGLRRFSYHSNPVEKDLFMQYPDYFTQERLLDILYGIGRRDAFFNSDSFKLCVKHIYDYFTEYNPEDILIRFGVDGICMPSQSKIYGKYVYNEKEFKFSKEVAKKMGMVFLSEDY